MITTENQYDTDTKLRRTAVPAGTFVGLGSPEESNTPDSPRESSIVVPNRSRVNETNLGPKSTRSRSATPSKSVRYDSAGITEGEGSCQNQTRSMCFY